MIKDLQLSLAAYSASNGSVAGGNSPPQQTNSNGGVGGSSSVKQRISLIGKARVTCGAINLLRMLSHETIVHACRAAAEGESRNNTLYPGNSQSALEYDTNYILKESFTYRGRGGVDVQNDGQDAAMEIISSIMTFLSSIGCISQQGKDFYILAIPEMYDVITQIFSLLLVLLSTQLYQPMASSAELANEGGPPSSHLFLEKWVEYSNWQRGRSHQQQKNKEERIRQAQAQNFGQENTEEQGSHQNEPLLFLYLCLHWFSDRPSPPRRSRLFPER